MNSLKETKEACKDKLLDMLATKSYRHGDFSLASGRKSRHYVNCKPVSLSGVGLELLSYALLEHVEEDSLAVAGLTLGADPLVSAVAMAASQMDRRLDALIVRKEAKGHGTGAWLEGPMPPQGSLVTVLEDVVTTGGSSLKAVKQLRDAGYTTKKGKFGAVKTAKKGRKAKRSRRKTKRCRHKSGKKKGKYKKC